MSVPDDWRVWSLEGRTDPVWPVVPWAEVLGPGVERHEVLYSSEPQSDTGDYRGDSCLLQLYRRTDVTAQEVVADMEEKSSLVVPDVAVDAMHEQVARLRYDIGFLPLIEFYAIADGETLAVLQCIGFERNYDRWLSIAETFEFLPVEE